jgi:predicted DNA-binding transcriptional regulator AlpA
MNKWLTIPQTMKLLNVSRTHIYTLASQYDWRSQKIGNTRLYHEADVIATPSADERQRLGYENRK